MHKCMETPRGILPANSNSEIQTATVQKIGQSVNFTRIFIVE